jgi:hypothetical protein
MAGLAYPLASGAGSLGVFAFRSELLMNGSLTRDIEAWEDDGGAVPAAAVWLSGFAAQVEWAERIRCQVNAEFDRVAASFRSIASRQSPAKRAQTEAIIAILEEKRAEVMRREQAGYFIHDWQEISDQVRQMIFHDARYQAIKSKRTPRRSATSFL